MVTTDFELLLLLVYHSMIYFSLTELPRPVLSDSRSVFHSIFQEYKTSMTITGCVIRRLSRFVPATGLLRQRSKYTIQAINHPQICRLCAEQKVIFAASAGHLTLH